MSKRSSCLLRILSTSGASGRDTGYRWMKLWSMNSGSYLPDVPGLMFRTQSPPSSPTETTQESKRNEIQCSAVVLPVYHTASFAVQPAFADPWRAQKLLFVNGLSLLKTVQACFNLDLRLPVDNCDMLLLNPSPLRKPDR
jgi:hypothetical protein